MIQKFTDDNFKDKVINSTKPSMIDFSAEWCGPCRAIGPIIDQLSVEYPGMNIGKVDVDTNPQMAIKYQITSIPAVVFIKNGEVVQKVIGAQPKVNYTKVLDSLK